MLSSETLTEIMMGHENEALTPVTIQQITEEIIKAQGTGAGG